MTMQPVSPATASSPSRTGGVGLVTAFPRNAVPTTGDACDAMLSRAERRLWTDPSAVSIDLSRFLGAASAVWTPARRDKLHRILISAGDPTVSAVLSEIASHPTAEVLDAAVVVLGALVSDNWPLAVRLINLGGVHANPHVRIATSSALSRCTLPGVLEVLTALLKDPDPAVRESTAWSLATRGEVRALRALRDRLAIELDPRTRETLIEAIQELSPQG